MQTHFGRNAQMTKLTSRQYEIAIGSLLGDATLTATTSGYAFRAHHGIAQRELVDWKYRELRNLVRTPPRISGRGYYFRTVTHSAFSQLRAEFYRDGIKTVPADLLRRYLTPLALAVWIMDDGAAEGRQLRLNTQCFSDDEARTLASVIEGIYGCAAAINYDKGRPRLRFPKAAMNVLRPLVAPHLLPSMRYKIPALP